MYSRKLHLLTTTLALAGMVGAPLQSYAQSPGPAAAPPASQDDSNYAGDTAGDPPARVGRLAIMDGTVSTHGSGDDHWSPAVLNSPVSTGDAYWTEPQALAKIEVTGSAVWLAESTEFDIATLNDAALHASEPQGEAFVQLAQLQSGETYTLETPRGTVTLAANGRYDVVAGDTQHPTMVTVLEGAAQVTGNNLSVQVHANQTASITGDTTFQSTVGPLVQDDFIAAVMKRDAGVVAQAGCPPVVAQMTGGTDLNHYGSWQQSTNYGSVWYPQVSSDWVPYRDGRWSYNAPWGWTWVDNAPWGFAPFHYGRWVQYGGRWGWAPGYAGYGGYERPVYAPALVSFFGNGVGVGVGVGIGVGLGIGIGANVGWVPLGFGEPYYPGYRASRGYLSRVNVINVRNVTNIYNERNTYRDYDVNHFANNHAATFVAARTMQESQLVRGETIRPGAAELARFHPAIGRAPLDPGGRTMGLSPAQAQRMNVRDYEARRAPGPQLAAEGRGTEGRPELRPGTGGPQARPQAGAGPAMMMMRGPAGLPGLRAPGARPDTLGTRPDAVGGAGAHPDAAGPRIDHAGIGADHPALRAPGATPEDRGLTGRPGEPAHPNAAARPAENRPEAGAAARERAAEAPHERAAEAPREPRPEAARPAERPAIRAERPAPRAEERPHAEAPRAQAPRPEAPRPQAPRPQAPHAHAEAPHAGGGGDKDHHH